MYDTDSTVIPCHARCLAVFSSMLELVVWSAQGFGRVIISQ